MLLSAIQMVSQPDPKANLERLRTLLAYLPKSRPQLVVLPENFACYGGSNSEVLALANVSEQIISELNELARSHQLWLLAGTLPLPAADAKVTASSLLFSPEGDIVGRYDKLHLFDVDVADNVGSYRESALYQPGQQPAVVATPFGLLGMAICYDLRFPSLFTWMRQQGAELITLPAAFTEVTGRAHWQVLLRARAIENQCYLVASGQGGVHANGRETYGHTMIIDPWGEVLAELDKGEGSISVCMDRQKLQRIRSTMPLLQHARFHCPWHKESECPSH